MEVIKALKERRSINFFDPSKEITEEEINELISVANLSPSSFNLQPWEVVVVNNPDTKETLRECAFNQPKITEASAVLIVLANPNAVEENLERVIDSMVELGYIKKEESGSVTEVPYRLYGESDSIARRMFAVKNASFFAMSIMIAAKGMGFETHPIDGFSEGSIKDQFNIPYDRAIPLLIAVGYPQKDAKILPRAFRRDVGEFVNYNIYL